MPVELKVLGPVSVRGADEAGPHHSLTQPLPLALLCYLALARPRGPHSRDTLVALLWPDADQAGARQGLRNALHRIRAGLGDGLILTEGDASVAVDRSRLACDALRFEDLTAERKWAEALALYSGELLQGFHVGAAPEFERWLDGERVRFREAAAGVGWSLAAELKQRGDLAGASSAAHQAHALSPDDERSLRRLLDALVAAGDRTAAIRAYEEFASRLASDLDAEPSAETQAALRAVREGANEPVFARAPTTPPASPAAITNEQPQSEPGEPPDAPAATLRLVPPPPRARRTLTAFLGGGLVAVAAAIALVVAASGGRPAAEPVDIRALVPAGADLAAVWRADSTNLRRYLRAQAHLKSAEVSAARVAFTELVDEDPLYAPGWAGLSVALYQSGTNDMPPREAMAKALAAAQRALALDSTLADARLTLIAYDLFWRWDLESAKRGLDAAIERYPGHSEFYNLLGTWYRFKGDMAASLEVKEANRERDPLAEKYAYQVASSLYWAHRCEEAALVYRRLPAELRSARGNVKLYQSLRCEGKEDEAAAALRDAMIVAGDTALARQLEPPLSPERRAAAVEAVFRKRLAQEFAKRRERWSPAHWIMLQYGEMQNADSTLIWLDSMLVERATLLHVVPTDPLNDFMRDDPRFQAFLRRLPWLERTDEPPVR
jgi:DNA-binding SARP family transcriptional activator